ncbi:MAG TPA: hypothetical protein VGQ76_08050 [Thermoanaerobaculia bacterium]|jgi:hypothetical protein|nr:hypothetical protein [Thermoanaerobaculia bacterium]
MPTVWAQQPRFEAVVAGQSVFGCMILPLSTPTVDWFTPDAHSIEPQPNSIRDLASSPGRPVYAVAGGKIFTIQPDGTRALFFDSATSLQAVTVASNGRIFARAATTLSVISSAGVLEATHALPSALGMIAVANDSCTIYYDTFGPQIGRINGCTGVVLPDFPPMLSSFMDLHPLPNGNVLIATDSAIVLYDVSGSVIRTIATTADYSLSDVYSFQQVAASPDSQTLYIAAMNWCGDTPGPSSLLLTALMEDGSEQSRREMPNTNAALALVVGSASFAGVPTTSETALLILALVLAFGGAFILKR